MPPDVSTRDPRSPPRGASADLTLGRSASSVKSVSRQIAGAAARMQRLGPVAFSHSRKRWELAARERNGSRRALEATAELAERAEKVFRTLRRPRAQRLPSRRYLAGRPTESPGSGGALAGGMR